MTTDQDPDLHALQTVTARLIELLVSVDADQWDSATPCSGWNLSDLVDHVTGGNWFTVMVVAGAGAEETMARFGGASVSCEAAIPIVERSGGSVPAVRGA